MSNMKMIYKLIILMIVATFVSCEVDDYSDANPKPLKDGPEIHVANPATLVVSSTRSDGSVITYVTKGQDANFEVNVVDSPGLIDSVSAFLSDTVGLVNVTGFDALKGSETGTFNMVYTPEPDGPGTFDDNIVNLSVTVTDAQDPAKTTQPTVRRVKAIACVPTIDLSGFWQATSSGTSAKAWTDGSVAIGGNFTGLNKIVRLSIRTTGGNATVGTNVTTENAGVLFIDDASFGLWAKQAFATPAVGRFTFCGNTLTGYSALNAAGTAFAVAPQGTPVYTGTINNDGSITINWSNTFGDVATITLVRPAPF
jgi:hypothetical protein